MSTFITPTPFQKHAPKLGGPDFRTEKARANGIACLGLMNFGNFAAGASLPNDGHQSQVPLNVQPAHNCTVHMCNPLTCNFCRVIVQAIRQPLHDGVEFGDGDGRMRPCIGADDVHLSFTIGTTLRLQH